MISVFKSAWFTAILTATLILSWHIASPLLQNFQNLPTFVQVQGCSDNQVKTDALIEVITFSINHMMQQGTIRSAEDMIRAVREFGIIPFFKCGVPGWSIEELTDPDFWFYSSDQLGPWDWKIEVVREGDIAYGKFLSGKAAFATRDIYRHLINWRRSLPKYRVALGENCNIASEKTYAEATINAGKYRSDKRKLETTSEKLLRIISPIALNAIREHGTLESKELRYLCGEALTGTQLDELGDKYRSILKPAVKKNVMDGVLQFLAMGTWTVTGDMTRVYRGANLEYTGWQRSSVTTPDALFNTTRQSADSPFWEKFIEGSTSDNDAVECTPEESRQYLISHVCAMFPGNEAAVGKMI